MGEAKMNRSERFERMINRLTAKEELLTNLRALPLLNSTPRDQAKVRTKINKLEDDIRALKAEVARLEAPPPRKPWSPDAREGARQRARDAWSSPGFRQAMSDIQRASYEHRQDVTIKRRNQPE